MNRVLITGIGVTSPVGSGRDAFWENLTAGRSGVGPITLFDASTLPVRIAGEVKDLDCRRLGEEFPDVRVVERLNGGSRAGENERAAELCEERGYLGIGCSDAHLASHICACVTQFEAEIRNEGDLVEALLTGEFRPVWLEDTREAD